MIKKRSIISLLLLTALVGAPTFCVQAETKMHSDHAGDKASTCPLKHDHGKSTTCPLKAEAHEKHDHTKGDSCPLKKGQSCPVARKKVSDKVAPKKTSWDKWFGKDAPKKDAAKKSAVKKDAKKAATKHDGKKHHSARPQKSWWKFWSEDKKKAAGPADAKVRSRAKQEHRYKARKSGKSLPKKSKGKDKRGRRRSDKKGKKKSGGKKHSQKNRRGKKKRDKKKKSSQALTTTETKVPDIK